MDCRVARPGVGAFGGSGAAVLAGSPMECLGSEWVKVPLGVRIRRRAGSRYESWS